MRKFTEKEIERIEEICEFVTGGVDNFVDTEVGTLIRFDGEDYEEYSLAYLAEVVQSEFNTNVTLEIGATKLVIIEAGQDYVIKIPLAGRVPARFDESAEREGDYDNMYYYSLDDICYYGDDYCSLEVYNYNQMPESVKKIFCETIELGQLSSGQKFYVQERIDQTYFDVRKNVLDFTEEERDKAYSIMSTIEEDKNFRCQYELRSVIVYEMIKAYGEATTYDLYKSIIDLQINDIHYHNLGFSKEGSLKIFDYSGFER